MAYFNLVKEPLASPTARTDLDDLSSDGSESSNEKTCSEVNDQADQERRYPCSYPGCMQRFKRRYSLKDHINSHTGERPFVCPVSSCGRSFATSGNLARHKRIHPWLGKPLQCLVEGCTCLFPSEAKLERHMRSHFGESCGHQCEVPTCGKVFSTPGNLRRHIRINHNELRYRKPVDASAAFVFTPWPLAHPNVHPTRYQAHCGAVCATISNVSRDEELHEALQWLFDEQESIGSVEARV